LGSRAIAVQGDVIKPADLDRLYDRVKAEVGGPVADVVGTGLA
jgi:hypothetical protein